MEDYTLQTGDVFFIEVGRELLYSKDGVGKNISDVYPKDGRRALWRSLRWNFGLRRSKRPITG